MGPGGPPPDDEDPAAEFDGGDTEITLTPEELRELESDTAPTPSRPEYTLPGFELGRRAAMLDFFAQWDHVLAEERKRGRAEVLQAVRDHLDEDGAPADIAEAIIKALAARAGVKLG